jgi:hypothetical protein
MGQMVSGSEGSFTWNGGSMSLSLADGFEWQGEFDKQRREATPFGYRTQRVVTLLYRAAGTFRYYLAKNTTAYSTNSASVAGKAPVPSGVVGQLTLTTYTGQAYGPFYAILTPMRTGQNNTTAEPVMASYEWAMVPQFPQEVPS